MVFREKHIKKITKNTTLVKKPPLHSGPVTYSNCVFNYGTLTQSRTSSTPMTIQNNNQFVHNKFRKTYEPYRKSLTYEASKLPTPQVNSGQAGPIHENIVHQNSSRGGSFFRKKKLAQVKRIEKHALTEFWNPMDIPPFIRFMYDNEFQNLVPRMYKNLDVKEFAHLLFDFRKELNDVNFSAFEEKWSDNMWEQANDFTNQVFKAHMFL